MHTYRYTHRYIMYIDVSLIIHFLLNSGWLQQKHRWTVELARELAGIPTTDSEWWWKRSYSYRAGGKFTVSIYSSFKYEGFKRQHFKQTHVFVWDMGGELWKGSWDGIPWLCWKLWGNCCSPILDFCQSESVFFIFLLLQKMTGSKKRPWSMCNLCN